MKKEFEKELQDVQEKIKKANDKELNEFVTMLKGFILNHKIKRIYLEIEARKKRRQKIKKFLFICFIIIFICIFVLWK